MKQAFTFAVLMLGVVVPMQSQTLAPASDPNQPEIVYVKCGVGENFGIHEVASTSGVVVSKVNCGDVLISFGEEDEFYKVRTEQGTVGYIPSQFVSKTKQQAVPVSTKQELQVSLPPSPTTTSVPKSSTSWVQNQKLTIIAVSHAMKEADYTTTVPETSNTNCNVYSSSVNCNTTQYGGGTRTNAIYKFTEVVTHDDEGEIIQYTLARTARWVWNSMDWLADGASFSAEIKDKHMYVTVHKGGNQGKKETLKFDILDIRPVQEN